MGLDGKILKRCHPPRSVSEARGAKRAGAPPRPKGEGVVFLFWKAYAQPVPVPKAIRYCLGAI